MSERRLSKLQKWILENCFRVTVLLDRTALKELNSITRSYQCKACPKTNESVRIEKQSSLITHQCLKDGYDCPYFEFYKEDVLLSYFLLTPNDDKAHINRVQHFHDSDDYAKAHVTAHRSINGLVEKGLVYAWSIYREDSLKISLTDEGMKKAAELLEISEWDSLIGR